MTAIVNNNRNCRVGSGWTPENKAEYLEATENVKAVYVEALTANLTSALPPIADINPHRLERLLLANSGHQAH